MVYDVFPLLLGEGKGKRKALKTLQVADCWFVAGKEKQPAICNVF